MLVLTRKPGEQIHIGAGITITVVDVRANKIRIGIDAPRDIPVLRAELNDFLTLPMPTPAPSNATSRPPSPQGPARSRPQR